MWKAATVAVAMLLLTGSMSINDEPPSLDEMAYIREIMPHNVFRVHKIIDFNQVQFEVQMFRGAEPIGVTLTLYTPYSWEMFKEAVEQASIAVSQAGRRLPDAVRP